ncbi:unnamed protein product [Chrysoparadoxa australica]
MRFLGTTPWTLLCLLAALLASPSAAFQANVGCSSSTNKDMKLTMSAAAPQARSLKSAKVPEMPVMPAVDFISKPADLTATLGDVPFPEPLSPVDRVVRAFTFWSRIVPLLYSYWSLEQSKGEAATEAEWNELHERGSALLKNTIMELKGFYVKTAQVMSTRVDLFPEQYTSKLMEMQDNVTPVDSELIKSIISKELLEGESLSTLFKSFDEDPLGSASIAQVHKAQLLDGRVVAVKVQRPSEEPKLRADLKNLKAFALRFRESLPVDYYPVFTELERALTNELDFRAEAQAMEKIAASVAHTVDQMPAKPPLYIPRPIPGLCTDKVLVMEYVSGIGLNKLKEKMEELGVMEESPEAKLLGFKMLTALTEAFARMIFGDGFLHGDPHPGNIFLMDGARVALIDCGQVKQLPVSQRLQLADLVVSIGKWGKPDAPSVEELAEKVKAFGVTCEDGAGDACLAAAALMLFGPTGCEMPGGYSNKELSNNSPLKYLKAFPQELVMMGRATVLIKGIASALDISWNLGEAWTPAARAAVLCGEEGCLVPVYAREPSPLGGSLPASDPGRLRFTAVRSKWRETRSVAKDWMMGKMMETLPEGMRIRVVKYIASKIDSDGQQPEIEV